MFIRWALSSRQQLRSKVDGYHICLANLLHAYLCWLGHLRAFWQCTPHTSNNLNPFWGGWRRQRSACKHGAQYVLLICKKLFSCVRLEQQRSACTRRARAGMSLASIAVVLC